MIMFPSIYHQIWTEKELGGESATTPSYRAKESEEYVNIRFCLNGFILFCFVLFFVVYVLFLFTSRHTLAHFLFLYLHVSSLSL